MFAYFLIGLAGCGKTTIRKHLVKFNSHLGFQVLSYDDYIIDRANRLKVSPQSIYESEIEAAKRYVMRHATLAFATKRPVIWDTHDNLTVADRDVKLKMVPEGYRKIALVFETIEGRKPTFDRDLSAMELPSDVEGFDEIRNIKV